MSIEPFEPIEGKHYVYRLYDADMNLLYVGVTSHCWQRMLTHRYEKPWWDQVDLIEWMQYPHRYLAFKAEWEAIGTENPRHNLARSSPFVDYAAEMEADARWHDLREALVD